MSVQRKAVFAFLGLFVVVVHLTACWYYMSIILPIFQGTNMSDAETTPIASPWARNESLIVVDVDGNFTDRVAHFNVALRSLRQQLLLTYNKPVCLITHGRLRVVWSTRENYIDELRDNPDILTVTLPWLGSRHNWSSMSDFSNVPYQHYHEWTADNVLCSWIESPRVIKMRYDSVYRRTCNRNISGTARGQSLQPLYLNARPLNPSHYWPNNGDSYPEHFYTATLPYVFRMHIHRDAIVTALGDVITANTKLVLYACSHDITPTLPHGVNLTQVPCYDEVYVITQYWGTSVFHRMAEIVPRLAFCLKFLATHPEIRILAPEVGGRLAELLEIIGLNKSRLITGVTRAKIVYQPRATGCGFANVQESQMLSLLYRDYIRRTFPPQPRNRMILIRRKGSRRFTEQKTIEELIERTARDYTLTYTLFRDDPTPSLNDTMMMFHSAVVIVAPHGAGESNIYFSQPGTYIVEGVCNLPHVNLCFQRLAHILGHHWHGVTSRGGCEAVVAVSAASVHNAVLSYLRLWMLEQRFS